VVCGLLDSADPGPLLELQVALLDLQLFECLLRVTRSLSAAGHQGFFRSPLVCSRTSNSAMAEAHNPIPPGPIRIKHCVFCRLALSESEGLPWSYGEMRERSAP
jgi:hypothetical protein